MGSTHEEAHTDTTEIPLDGRSSKVDLPQLYGSWREYAFSEYPEGQGSTN